MKSKMSWYMPSSMQYVKALGDNWHFHFICLKRWQDTLLQISTVSAVIPFMPLKNDTLLYTSVIAQPRHSQIGFYLSAVLSHLDKKAIIRAHYPSVPSHNAQQQSVAYKSIIITETEENIKELSQQIPTSLTSEFCSNIQFLLLLKSSPCTEKFNKMISVW